MACLNFLLFGIYLSLRQRYTLELEKDNYDRRSLSEFALDDQVCIRGEHKIVSSNFTETTNVSFVSEHVIALENALKRRAND